MSFFRSAAACRAPPLLDAHWSAEKLASHIILEDDQSSFRRHDPDSVYTSAQGWGQSQPS